MESVLLVFGTAGQAYVMNVMRKAGAFLFEVYDQCELLGLLWCLLLGIRRNLNISYLKNKYNSNNIILILKYKQNLNEPLRFLCLIAVMTQFLIVIVIDLTISLAQESHVICLKHLLYWTRYTARITMVLSIHSKFFQGI